MKFFIGKMSSYDRRCPCVWVRGHAKVYFSIITDFFFFFEIFIYLWYFNRVKSPYVWTRVEIFEIHFKKTRTNVVGNVPKYFLKVLLKSFVSSKKFNKIKKFLSKPTNRISQVGRLTILFTINVYKINLISVVSGKIF